MSAVRPRLALACAALVLSLSSARAQVNEPPRELAGVGIDEKPGALLPRDVTLRDQEGRAVKLGDYLDAPGPDARPLVVVFAYFRCPMLCSMVLNGLDAGLKQLAWNVGDRYRVVVISIDPTDTAAMAMKKRANLIADYGRPVPDKGWDFLVGDAGETRRAAEALGFRYKYDPEQKQYAHGAGAFVFTKDGRLSRTLYGIVFPESSLRLSLVEASQGRLGSTIDRIILLCYHYDPHESRYVLGARRFMQAGGLLTVLLIGFLFARLSRSGARVTTPDGPLGEPSATQSPDASTNASTTAPVDGVPRARSVSEDPV